MPEWATISIREELIEEIRQLLKRTGRYRSISEFVAESIRHRLEELSEKSDSISDSFVKAQPTGGISLMPGATLQPVSQGARVYINSMVQRSEQMWWVLFRLFGDMARKEVNVDAECARDLRNCRTLINFVRSHTSPDCDMEMANKRLPDLNNSLEQVKRDLIATALNVSDEYAKDWMDEIERAERGELRDSPSLGPRFVPGLPRNNEAGWTRVTLSKPLPKERAQEISKLLGVDVKHEDSVHLVVKGEKKAVKKAVEMVYQEQLR
jgi:hypothetical protein